MNQKATLWKFAVCIALTGALYVFCRPAPAQNAQDDDKAVTVISAGGVWRKHYTIFPLRLSEKEARRLGLPTDEESRTEYLDTTYRLPPDRKNNTWGIQGKRRAMYLAGIETPPPPDDWTNPDYDDSGWLRDQGVDFVGIRATFPQGYNEAPRLPEPNREGAALVRGTDSFVPEFGLISMRGRFIVEDRTRVEGLRFSISYRGGFVAYLNGREFARGSLPDGEIDYRTPAEDYPDEAFMSPDGRLPMSQWTPPKLEYRAGWLMRERHYGPSEIDPALLRNGINVLAIELHRSDYPALSREVGPCFATIGLGELFLETDAPDGVIRSSVERPEGLRAWTAPAWQLVADTDYPAPGEEAQPLRLAGARNGVFSGQVVLSSTSAIEGLTVSASDLRSIEGEEEAVIPASAVRVRFGVPNPLHMNRQFRWKTGLAGRRFDMLLDVAPDVIPTVDLGMADSPLHSRSQYGYPRKLLDPPQALAWSIALREAMGLRPQPKDGAGAALWVEIRTPEDAAPGNYIGSLRIEARGEAALEVPVELSVADWSLPDIQDFRPMFFAYQSPETLAIYYDVEPWSEEHWRLIERSLELMGRGGNIGLIVPLLAETTFGNSESMVRWLPLDDGGWGHDFSLFDRYIDIALKYHHPDRLKSVCAIVWGLELDGDQPAGAQVTVLDPENGARRNMTLPDYGSEECEDMLRPMLLELKDHLDKRGLGEKLMFGASDDRQPHPHHTAMLDRILPGTPWYSASHRVRRHLAASSTDPDRRVPVGISAAIYGVAAIGDPRQRRAYGWRFDPDYILLDFNRHNHTNLTLYPFPEPWPFHLWLEASMISGRQGGGRVGADYFALPGAPFNGNILFNRYPASSVSNRGLNWNTSDLLAPGPDGPVSTARFENTRLGMQQAEARAFIEEALTDTENPLPAELAERCRELLDGRVNAVRMWKLNEFSHGNKRAETPFGALNWHENTRTLFELAGEVESALTAQDAAEH